SREFIMVNLGLVYLHADQEPKLLFVEDIFRRRLSNTADDFPASELADLVGTDNSLSNNEQARRIRAGEKTQLWGKEVLCKLCSGDIHYLISLVGNMVRLAGGASALQRSNARPRIAPQMQNKSIRAAAGDFLKNLTGVPRGKELVAIVEAFGNVAKSHL